MKARLQTSLTQQLAITPQLQQAIRLLQLPVSELATELSDAVASNPLLEWAGESPDDGGESPIGRDAATDAVSESPTVAPLSDDTPWSASGSGREDDNGDEDFSQRLSSEQDLQGHLRSQLHLHPLSPCDAAIGDVLVDAIDADGYLRTPLEDIAAILPSPLQVTPHRVLAVLRLIQSLEPTGVGARDLAECLTLQLQQLPGTTPAHTLALQLAAGDLQQLPRTRMEDLARRHQVDPPTVQAAIALLRSLNPRPGSQFSTDDDRDHVLPDIILWRANGQWQARLGAHAGPPVTINQQYAGMIGQCSDGDAGYLRAQLQQARWLIKGLQARGQTLLRVAQCLIRHQSGYLEFGEQALMPLTLREIAAELELHESTISRAIAGKYVQTPRGTVPMRQFFSQAVVGGDGNEASGTAIQAVIRRLVEAENPRKPLSDAKLVEQLQAAGITVARRTVAKYREAMSIPPSHERVRMG